jgi:hypothetical protein
MATKGSKLPPPSERPWQFVQVRLSRDEVREWRSLAQRADLNLAQVIRRQVRLWVREQQQAQEF